MAFRKLTSRIVRLPNENVDTDQIIPARFLKTTEKAGMGKLLFYDWRYVEEGNPRADFVLNRPEAAGRAILLAGNNFGCGSSREHAPWALVDFGFRAIISTSFADIFRNNSLKNGLLPVVVDRATHERLFRLLPDAEVVIDLAAQTLSMPDGTSADFPLDPFAKTCLLEGIDELGYLMTHADAIARYEAAEGK